MSRSTSSTSRSGRPTRRRPTRMAVSTASRYQHARRREAESRWDWHDALIPAGVLSVIGTIVAYHHDVFAGALSLVF